MKSRLKTTVTCLAGLSCVTYLFLFSFKNSQTSDIKSSSNCQPPAHVIQACNANLGKIDEASWQWYINTSNPSKKQEFLRFFSESRLTLTGVFDRDLDEIDSTEVNVVVHKASQMEKNGVIVEDSSLDVEGADFGINIKWLLDRIPEYLGRKATLTSHVAYRVGEYVYVYKGQVQGKLVAPRGVSPEGSPLNRYFEPVGSSKTLAEQMDDGVNPRAIAFESLRSKDYHACKPVIRSWAGAWQKVAQKG